MFQLYRTKNNTFPSLNSLSSQSSFNLTQEKSTEDIFLNELKEINEEFGKYKRLDEIELILRQNEQENSVLKKKVLYFTKKIRKFSKLNMHLRRLLKKAVLRKNKTMIRTISTQTSSENIIDGNNDENIKQNPIFFHLNTELYDKIEKNLINLAEHACFLIMIYTFYYFVFGLYM